MKIAITSRGKTLSSDMDPRFGRCAFFLIVDTRDMSFRAIENDNASRGGGAGIQSTRAVAEQGVEALLTGFCGPNAHEALSAAKIPIFTGCQGTVSEAIEQFLSGKLEASRAPNASSHAGVAKPSH
jgi:predicted Fe-Mo cluster-binding NifX family protein